jgi:hypothetical protein
MILLLGLSEVRFQEFSKLGLRISLVGMLELHHPAHSAYASTGTFPFGIGRYIQVFIDI